MNDDFCKLLLPIIFVKEKNQRYQMNCLETIYRLLSDILKINYFDFMNVVSYQIQMCSGQCDFLPSKAE